jgi:mono/diheme cytochrome c family protein
MSSRLRRIACAVGILVCFATPALAENATPDAAEATRFFEAEVRPILVERCVECHGPDAQESGIRLDSRADMLKGNDAGPIVTPESPDASRLLHVVRYDGKVQMPPDEKLPDEQIAALEKWVSLGAPWPESAQVAAVKLGLAERITAARETHWSLQPMQAPPLPAVTDTAWPTNALDFFVLSELEKAGLAPSPSADRRTWLRRVTYDLTGLPPTYDEVMSFEADSSPAAYETVVDRLLSSPQYGERWGRHWLDVARYADTKGYVFTEDRRYPFSYTYRDYVIRAMNEDLPYERFVTEQIAADRLELGDDKRALAAMGFLTVGRRFSNNMHDIIDDRIDVVSRGFLGLTVGCARCHDHKYDPIGSADYYAMYGIFASCHEPDDRPLIGKPEATEAYQKFEAELKTRRDELTKHYEENVTALKATLRTQTTKFLLLVVKEMMGEDLPDIFDVISDGEELHPRMVERWRRYLDRQIEPDHPVLGPWKRLAEGGSAGYAERAAKLFAELEAGAWPELNATVRATMLEKRPTSMFEVANLYGELLVAVDQKYQELLKERPDAKELDDASAEALRQVLYGNKSPTVFNEEVAQRLFTQKVQGRYLELKAKVQEWEVTSPDAPERAMVLVDNDTPYKPHVFARGNPSRPEQEVPRRFVEVLEVSGVEPFEAGSGRLELAKKIVAHDNPLTYRVWMNRVWLQHFGMSLVRDPSDFGMRSDPPSHPALLDFLATNFLADGQSLKRLHRMIVLSSTYRQQSMERADGIEIDPENRLYWRMNPRRLEFEAYRDSLLVAAGRLERQLGGRPVDLNSEPFTTRRTVYGYIDRQVLPDLFRTFDFASPDASTAQRPKTTVPQQALFAMNSSFSIEQAKHLVARAEIAEKTDAAERVKALYRSVLARDATEDETQLGCQFIASCGTAEGQPLGAWEQFAQVLLMSNEFAFVD